MGRINKIRNKTDIKSNARDPSHAFLPAPIDHPNLRFYRFIVNPTASSRSGTQSHNLPWITSVLWKIKKKIELYLKNLQNLNLCFCSVFSVLRFFNIFVKLYQYYIFTEDFFPGTHPQSVAAGLVCYQKSILFLKCEQEKRDQSFLCEREGVRIFRHFPFFLSFAWVS